MSALCRCGLPMINADWCSGGHFGNKAEELTFKIVAYDEIIWPEGPWGRAIVRKWRADDEDEP